MVTFSVLLWLCCKSFEPSTYGNSFCYGYIVNHLEPDHCWVYIFSYDLFCYDYIINHFEPDSDITVKFIFFQIDYNH